MITSKQRFFKTMDFANPDRLPVFYHPSTAGLHVHGEKLRALFLQYPPDNPITFDRLTVPPAGTIRADGTYYEEYTDEWGVRWGKHIFGIGGQPVAHPLASWSDGADYVFPALPAPDSTEFRIHHRVAPDMAAKYPILEGWISLFMQLYALRPMEEVLMDLAGIEDDLVLFLDRLAGYCSTCVDFVLAKGADAVMFADDWAAQGGPLVSPAVFRDVFKPHYRKLFAQTHAAGAKVFFHCCGKMDYILPELFELGIDGLWHQSALYDHDAFAQQCKDAGVTVYLHPDRQQLIPLGTPEQIRTTIRRFADRYHRMGGGAIFYVEIENDAPFENVKALIEAIDAYR